MSTKEQDKRWVDFPPGLRGLPAPRPQPHPVWRQAVRSRALSRAGGSAAAHQQPRHPYDAAQAALRPRQSRQTDRAAPAELQLPGHRADWNRLRGPDRLHRQACASGSDPGSLPGQGPDHAASGRTGEPVSREPARLRKATDRLHRKADGEGPGTYRTKDLILKYYDDQATGNMTTWHGPEELKEPKIHPLRDT